MGRGFEKKGSLSRRVKRRGSEAQRRWGWQGVKGRRGWGHREGRERPQKPLRVLSSVCSPPLVSLEVVFCKEAILESWICLEASGYNTLVSLSMIFAH